MSIGAHAQDLQVERLTWAGIKLVSGDTSVFIDAVGQDLWGGNAPGGLIPVTADTTRRYALISHTHNDHLDTETLKAVLGDKGYLICHEDDAAYLASRGMRVIPARMYEPVFRGGFMFIAVPAEDGFGDKQVSWVVATDKYRVLHAGDTLWHGQWGNLGRQYGPFDMAFLPINGARVQTTPTVSSPRVQTPAQAIDAAALLRAKVVVPIHYGLNDPPNYVEVADPLKTLIAIADARNQDILALKPGEGFTLQQSEQ